MYPDIQSYDRGLLDTGDGNSIYWECCGNPTGKPAVYLHGGPGSGCTPGARRFFNPETFRIVLFDQRGCGRSRPLLNDRSQLAGNTTQHLIRDIELLRAHLSIERWAILGVSWGTTLALAYAQTCPERVNALVLACVTTTSHAEVEWLTRGVARIFPQEWESFASHIPMSLRGERIVDAYAKLLFDDSPAVAASAAAQWCAWEESHISLVPHHAPNRRFEDAAFRLRFARFVTHYWRHAAFLDEDQLLRDSASLRNITGVLIHGRYDVSSPLQTAWRLHKRWAESKLHVVEDAGHGGGALAKYIVDAVNRI